MDLRVHVRTYVGTYVRHIITYIRMCYVREADGLGVAAAAAAVDEEQTQASKLASVRTGMCGLTYACAYIGT